MLFRSIDYTYEFAAYKFNDFEEMKEKMEEKYKVTDFSTKADKLEGAGQISLFDYV